MAPEQNTINSSDINQLKKDREALIAQKNETYKKAVAVDGEVKKAIERCPKKENASSAKLQERINQMEEEIEISSLSASQEKEQKRKIAELKKQITAVAAYEKAQQEIENLKKTREALFKESNELGTKITALSETLLVSEAILRIKEITGQEIAKESLDRVSVPVPTEKVGRLCGKANSHLHALEADYKVYIQNNRDSFLIVGEKVNVQKCEAMVNDLLNEVESKVKLEKNEIHALLAHDSHYRHMIEKDYHINTRLADNETLLLMGGANSVKQAEHAIHDLFKKKTEVSVTPFIRSLFLENSMKLFKEVQEKCSCYLGMNADFSGILLYGLMEDQKKASKILTEFVATHREVKEEVECSPLFYSLLFSNKAKELTLIRQAAHVQMNGTKNVVTVSGLEENVKKAIALLNERREKMEKEMIVNELNAAQITELLTKGNSFLKELREKEGVCVDLNRNEKKLCVVCPEEKKEELQTLIADKLAQIESVVVLIPTRLVSQFVGVKGQNIIPYQKKFSVQMNVDKSGELTISGDKENMKKAKEEVEAWLVHHTLCSMKVVYETALQSIVGKKGSIRSELEKELKVEIRVEKEGEVWVMGEPEDCSKAIENLEKRVKEFERTNKRITIRKDIGKYAPEFKPATLSKKMKEIGMEYQWESNFSCLHLHGNEEVIETASGYVNSILDQYKNYSELAVTIPKEQIGTLVGKNGEHIQSLQEEHHVVINVSKSGEVTLWGEEAELKKIEEAIHSDLKERVIVSKEISCSVSQVVHLTNDRFAVKTAIEEETGAKIFIPRDLPAMGPTTITLSGNEDQVNQAFPIVREAILGMLRQHIDLTSEELKGLLNHSSIQLQRLQLESRCRIQPSMDTGSILVVGPKEGIQLIYKRFWRVLSELYPAKYAMIVLEEVVRLGLEDRAIEKEIREEEEKEKCLIKVLNDCVICTCPEGSQVVSFMNNLIKQVNEKNHLFFVGKEMISFIIGTKGARINQVKKVSNTSLRVLHDEVVLITGEPEAIKKAIELLENAVEEYKSTHITLTVDETLVNAVRGIRNSNIQSIQRAHLVNINVDRSGVITISGPKKELVDKAHEELLQVIERVKENPEGIERTSRPARVTREEKKEVSAEGLWEKLKQAPLLPSVNKQVPKKEETKSKEVNRILGLSEQTVGGSDCYKSESGYTVDL